MRLRNGKLRIIREGAVKKFVAEVEHITFSGDYAVNTGQEVIYITERAVFRLDRGRIVLTEVAPGIDLQRDIVNQMEFEPIISEELK